MGKEEPIDLNKLREEAKARKARGEEEPHFEPPVDEGEEDEGEETEGDRHKTGTNLNRLREQVRTGEGVTPIDQVVKEEKQK